MAHSVVTMAQESAKHGQSMLGQLAHPFQLPRTLQDVDMGEIKVANETKDVDSEMEDVATLSPTLITPPPSPTTNACSDLSRFTRPPLSPSQLPSRVLTCVSIPRPRTSRTLTRNTKLPIHPPPAPTPQEPKKQKKVDLNTLPPHSAQRLLCFRATQRKGKQTIPRKASSRDILETARWERHNGAYPPTVPIAPVFIDNGHRQIPLQLPQLGSPLGPGPFLPRSTHVSLYYDFDAAKAVCYLPAPRPAQTLKAPRLTTWEMSGFQHVDGLLQPVPAFRRVPAPVPAPPARSNSGTGLLPLVKEAGAALARRTSFLWIIPAKTLKRKREDDDETETEAEATEQNANAAATQDADRRKARKLRRMESTIYL
ncbi:hypothetical protein MKEN_01002700 [Mycena kentingensis (nom. inval.)]|nr:hypothetical protein MKEN_01002700 [Mycena kentingensis (nom. inval.)]